MRRFLQSFGLTDWLVLLCAWVALVGLELTKGDTVFERMRTELERYARPSENGEAAPAAIRQASQCPVAQDYFGSVVHFGPINRLVIYEDLPQGSEAAMVFKSEFTEGAYFGAFAANDHADWAWNQGYGSPHEARRAVTALCEISGQPCRILAEILPATAVPSEVCAETTSHDQAMTYQEFRARTGQTRVFVRSRNGTSTWWYTDDLQEAARRALIACHQFSVKNEDLIDSPCQVVEAWQGAQNVPVSDLLYQDFPDGAGQLVPKAASGNP